MSNSRDHTQETLTTCAWKFRYISRYYKYIAQLCYESASD